MIIDGKKLAENVRQSLKKIIDEEKIVPVLAVISVGKDKASQIYVRNKEKAAAEIGVKCDVYSFSDDVSQQELENLVLKLNCDKAVNGIIIQQPLPKALDGDALLDLISPQKDVDGLTPYNLGKLFAGEEPYVYPCTPKGILLLLDKYGIELDGKHVVIVGRSNIVGKPLAVMMLNRNATVTVCHSHTKNLSEITKAADILVSAVGEKLIEDNMVKINGVVVDVGIFKDETGKTRGDVDFANVSKKTSFISPVPGGVGPMTIASLMLNTVELFDIQNRKKS